MATLPPEQLIPSLATVRDSYSNTTTGRYSIHESNIDSQPTLDNYQHRIKLNKLIQQIHIDYDPRDHQYYGQLNGYHICHVGRREDNQENDLAIRRHMIEQLLHHHMEQDPMPIAVEPLTIDIPNPLFGPPPELTETPEPRAPRFTIQQNTQAVELRKLREQYSHEVFQRNLQIAPIQALVAEREYVRSMIISAIRMKAVAHTLQNTPIKYRNAINELIHSQFTNRQYQELLEIQDDVTTLSSYQQAVQAIHEYRNIRAVFITDKERFGAQQAQYNQRSAMIRQKPHIPKRINTQEIIETVSQWENIWGVSIKKSMEGEELFIRVGFCDIDMTESAMDSAYDYPASIKLAPGYFTIKLKNNGTFVCRSDCNNVLGLSRGDHGTYGYDFHPHQLSDTPCFGTFGQTFIDLAVHGEVIALISGIIAFYSQYNSEDSAGVSARHFHPARLLPINAPASYSDTLLIGLKGWNYHTVNEIKLQQAMERYAEYHNTERHTQPPEVEESHFCYSCEDYDVSDSSGNEWYSDSNGERICSSCWNNYCSDCERHEEDCTCNNNDY